MGKNLYKKIEQYDKDNSNFGLYKELSTTEQTKAKKVDKEYERISRRLGNERLEEITQKFIVGRDIEKIKTVYRLSQDEYNAITRNIITEEMRKKRKENIQKNFSIKIGLLGNEEKEEVKTTKKLTREQARRNVQNAINVVEGKKKF